MRAIYKKVKQDNKETKILTEDDGEILETARSFYERLYKTPDSMDAGSPALLSGFLNNIPRGLISEPHYRNLDAPISLEECRTALMGMKNDKCPGLDGLTKEFYTKYWPLVGQLVLDSLTYAPSVGHLSISQRRGVIRLIPKKNRDPREVENWRPITMLNVDYKILTRVLALRLQNVLPTLTHPDQKGFIKGRDGKENVLDIYSMISLAEELSSNHVLVLLDIMKAFDSVSHNFLQEVLHAYGMPPSFLNWVKTIYARKEIRMMNNGYMSTPFTPIRGTAQGCSLSPLLFVLAIEALGNAIRLDPNIQGFNVSGNTKKLAMLADDTLVGMQSTPLAFESLYSTLYQFGLVSGLKINESKCLCVPLGDKQTILQDATRFPGLQVCDQPIFNYMGIDIPYTWNETGNLIYHPLDISPQVELIKDIIQPWNQWDVSLLGRVDVIKSFAGSKFTYLLQLAPTPCRSSIHKAQKMMDAFIWNNNNNLIASEIMKQPLKYGGIKSYHIETQNKALKFMWLAKLVDNPTGFWAKHLESLMIVKPQLILQCNYGHARNHMIFREVRLVPPFWVDILNLWSKHTFTPGKDIRQNEQILLNNKLGVTSRNIPLMLSYHALNIFTVNDFIAAEADLSPAQKKIT